MTPKAVSVLSKYKNLIPLVLGALDLKDEDLIHKVFETFNEFIEDLSKALNLLDRQLIGVGGQLVCNPNDILTKSFMNHHIFLVAGLDHLINQ